MWAGHPEGFAAAFGTIYDDAWSAIVARREGGDAAAAADLPTVDDGARGVQFVAAVVASHNHGSARVAVPTEVDGAGATEDA
jgi:hypothetical protein